MLQNRVTYGPVWTDMDRCAEVTARTRTGGESALPAPEVKPVSTSLPAISPTYKPFRQVCATFFTPGKIENPEYLYSSTGQADILVGGSIPDYPSCGVREIDSLARYYSCLGRLVPFLQEDLFASFRKVCQGFIIGEGHDCDYERVFGVISSLENLFHAAEACGNMLLRDMVLSYFAVMDSSLIMVDGVLCLRRFCYENGLVMVLTACYPTGNPAHPMPPHCSVLSPDLDLTIALEEARCGPCHNPHCPLRNYLGNRRENIRDAAGDRIENRKPNANAQARALSEAETRAIAPFMKVLREEGYLDEHDHWIKGGHKKAYAGWVARVIHYNVETVTQSKIGDLLGVTHILKAASDADGDLQVCNTIEKMFSDAHIPFSKPPRH